MKNYILVICASLLVATACKQTPNVNQTDPNSAPLMSAPAETKEYDSTSLTTIEWLDPTEKEVGQLAGGKETEITWRFRNSGDRPLYIDHVGATCGCTIPEKPDQPFAPGEIGTIRAKFNGSGSGFILKQVYVTANTKPDREHTLVFKGEVIEKK
jgi:hypothetical protein